MMFIRCKTHHVDQYKKYILLFTWFQVHTYLNAVIFYWTGQVTPGLSLTNLPDIFVPDPIYVYVTTCPYSYFTLLERYTITDGLL